MADWYFLFLIALLPLVHRWWVNRNKPARVIYSIPLPEEVSQKNPLKILLWIKYAAIVLVLFALARPQAEFKQTERTLSGIDILMALDVSASMNIEDLAERSRIDVAKDTLENFVKGRHNDRIGLIMFSGEPLTMSPPTLDYGLLIRAIHQANIGILRDGTAIGDGLSLAVSHLKNSKAASRVIILLTDGDNNLGQVDPATAGELAAGFGIRVYTIAIGREGRVKMPIRQRGMFGDSVVTYQWFDNALNPELLRLIANTTHGKFYRVTDEQTLGSVFKEIDQLERSDVKSKEKVRYDERFQKVLKLALILLLVGQILERGWWRMIT
ncbi:MAG: VWA domain-containing protein [Bdellovibrio sp.]|nr:VWA domain-containing protein [Bdellovibrio sp.]